MKLEGEWLNVIYSKTPNGVSHVTSHAVLTHLSPVLLLKASQYIL